MNLETALERAEASAPGEGERQYLTFLMAEEEYGVDILRVQEIRGWDSVTPIPNTPDYLKGVINLRGSVVPIVDLRLRFGLPALDYGPTTVVIVLRVEHDGGERVMGVVVDAVSDVHTLPEGEMKPPPDCGGTVDLDFIAGLVLVEERMIVVLDIDRLLNSDALSPHHDQEEAS